MYIIVWKYLVKQGKAREFEEAYGLEGAWVQLFRKAPAYQGTELLIDSSAPLTYVTIDHWDDRTSYESFLLQHRKEYDSIDSRCNDLTRSEERVGLFVDIDRKQ